MISFTQLAQDISKKYKIPTTDAVGIIAIVVRDLMDSITVSPTSKTDMRKGTVKDRRRKDRRKG